MAWQISHTPEAWENVRLNLMDWDRERLTEALTDAAFEDAEDGCDGPKTEECPECGGGDVTEECPECDGDGEVECCPGDVPDLEGPAGVGTFVPCDECNGSGEVEVSCDECDGSGEVETAHARFECSCPTATEAADKLRENLDVLAHDNLVDAAIESIEKNDTCDNGGFNFWIDREGIHTVPCSPVATIGMEG